MARIKTYAKDTIITDNDIVIGSDADNLGETKNYQVGDLRTFMLSGLAPEVGGTLRITEVRDDSEDYTTPAEVLNNLSPVLNVVQYNVVIVSMLDSRYLFELQNVTVGDGETPVIDSNFIVLNKSVKSTGLDVSTDGGNILINNKEGEFLGDGTAVYDGLNSTTNVHKFKGLTSTGLEITSNSTDVNLESLEGTNLGDGVKVYKGLNATDKLHEFNTLASSDMTISTDQNTGVISFTLPQSSSIPSIYISQDYEPSYDDWLKANRAANPSGPTTTFSYKGEGTLAKPFTNTCTYTLGNTNSFDILQENSAVQNGFEDYLGDGTRLLPEKRGQKIQVLSSVGYHNYAGDFNYSFLNLEINGVLNTTIGTSLVNLDDSNFFAPGTDRDVIVTINIIGSESRLIVSGTGFFNSGNSINDITYIYRKQIELYGTGEIVSVINNPNNYIINAGVNFQNNRNAGHTTFNIGVNIYCIFQGIIVNSGKSFVEFRDTVITSGAVTSEVNVNLEAIKITGGRILFLGGSITFFNQNEVNTRNYGIVFDAPSGTEEASIIMRNITFGGQANTWFYRKGIVGSISVLNCSSLYFGGITTTLFGTSGSRVWGKDNISTEGFVTFIGNVIENTKVDFTKVDFTTDGQNSVSNIIGKDVILSLKIFDSTRAAKLANIPLGGAFIKRVILTDASHFNSYRLGDEFKIFAQSATPFNFGPYALAGGTITAVGDYFQKNLTPSPAWSSGVQLSYEQISVVS